MLWLLLSILGIAGLVLVLAGDSATIGGLESSTIAQAAIGAALLLFVGGSVLADYRGRLGQAAKDMLVWVAIAFVLVLGYSYRDTFRSAAQRVAGELLPPGEHLTVEGATAGEKAVRIRRQPDGHFVARTAVNGANVSMLVDTGASTVVLSPADAKAAGIDIGQLSYSVPVRTANGSTYAAPARLRRIAIGAVVIEDVDALVARPGALHQSLLGMSFLTRLRSYEVSGEFLTLRG